MIDKRLFEILPTFRKHLWGLVAFAFIFEAVKLIPPYLMKVFIDMLLEPNVVFDQVLYVIGGIFAATCLSVFIHRRSGTFGAYVRKTAETETLIKAHKKLMSLGLKYYEKQQTGSLSYIVNKGSARLLDLLYFIDEQFMGSLLQILLTTIVLLYVHFWAGMIFLVAVVITLFLIANQKVKSQEYREAYYQKGRQAAWQMNQGLQNIRTVKDFVQEKKEEKKYASLINEYKRLALIRYAFENNLVTKRELVLSVARFSVLAYTAFLVYSGSMTAGTLVLFATLSEKVFVNVFRVGRLYNYLGDAMEDIENFTNLFDQEPDIQDKPGAKPCPKLEGHVTLNNVSFAYEKEAAVKNLNMDIPAKKVVAVIGRSGAGKTTLIKLLGRHYDVNKGSIKVDGVDIRDFKVGDYREKISVVSQDIEIFDTTVKANIAYGRSASQKEIEKVAKLAHAHEFIKELPKGYNTQVGEKGIKLSGGQKQRIGIARALLMKPAILVFDEATSSLDTESERLIQDALHKIAHKQTMFIIAHRLSTIEHADIVMVLEKGKIVECGSPKQLMKKKGVFARMRELQKLGELRN